MKQIQVTYVHVDNSFHEDSLFGYVEEIVYSTLICKTDIVDRIVRVLYHLLLWLLIIIIYLYLLYYNVKKRVKCKLIWTLSHKVILLFILEAKSNTFTQFYMYAGF